MSEHNAKKVRLEGTITEIDDCTRTRTVEKPTTTEVNKKSNELEIKIEQALKGEEELIERKRLYALELYEKYKKFIFDKYSDKIVKVMGFNNWKKFQNGEEVKFTIKKDEFKEIFFNQMNNEDANSLKNKNGFCNYFSHSLFNNSIKNYFESVNMEYTTDKDNIVGTIFLTLKKQ